MNYFISEHGYGVLYGNQYTDGTSNSNDVSLLLNYAELLRLSVLKNMNWASMILLAQFFIDKTLVGGVGGTFILQDFMEVYYRYHKRDKLITFSEDLGHKIPDSGDVLHQIYDYSALVKALTRAILCSKTVHYKSIAGRVVLYQVSENQQFSN